MFSGVEIMVDHSSSSFCHAETSSSEGIIPQHTKTLHIIVCLQICSKSFNNSKKNLAWIVSRPNTFNHTVNDISIKCPKSEVLFYLVSTELHSLACMDFFFFFFLLGQTFTPYHIDIQGVFHSGGC